MKKMKKTGYIALLAVSFLTGHYGLPFVRQPTEVIYVNKGTVVVKNFPRSRADRAEWWLSHKDWLIKKYHLDTDYLILFMDFATGFKTEGTDVSPFWAFWPDTDLLCFPDLKLVANCIEKKTFLHIIIRNEDGTETVEYYDRNGYFMYSPKRGIYNEWK